MQKNTVIISTVLMMSFLTACSEETKTVDWYIEHSEILAEEVEKCKLKTPAELMTDKHCTVIRQAQQKAFHEHQRNAPIPTFK